MQSRHFGLAGKKTTTPSSSACRMLQLRLWGMTLRFIGVVAELHLKLLLVVLFFSCWYGGQRCCWWEWGCRDVSGGGRDASPFYCFSLHCSLHSAAVCSITSDRSRRFWKKAIFSFPMPENNPDITAPLHITVCYVQLYSSGCRNIKIQYSLQRQNMFRDDHTGLQMKAYTCLLLFLTTAQSHDLFWLLCGLKGDVRFA